MTLKQLNQLKSLWQKRLRIQDWDITVEQVTHKQMVERVDADVLGACHCYNMKKKADIMVLHEADVDSREDDQETILVHELLHVVMPVKDLGLKFDDDSASFTAYERIVDQLARILVEAYRG